MASSQRHSRPDNPPNTADIVIREWNVPPNTVQQNLVANLVCIAGGALLSIVMSNYFGRLPVLLNPTALLLEAVSGTPRLRHCRRTLHLVRSMAYSRLLQLG